MALRDHAFPILLEHPAPDEGWYTLAGIRRGPFATPDALEADLLARLQRWDAHARTLGGWAWRRAHLELVVTLPDNVPVEGGSPLAPWVGRRP